MSKKDEALKLALEWLEYIDQQDNDRDFLGPEECCALDDTRNTIREALAEQPAQQEPVAWDNCRSEKQCRSWCGNSACASHWNDTSPPASKPWVGLTEEERMDVLLALNWDKRLTHMDTARAIEAKLREKNA